MPDRRTTVPESILAWFAGRDRAAAIIGDLLELGSTRGRLWFWTNYLRTLVLLGWRSAVPAFLVGFLCVRFMFGTVMWWLMNHRTPQLTDAGLFGEASPHVRMLFWNMSLMAAQFLCFAAPFVVIRFGLRSRLSQLAGALFLITIPVYSLRLWVMDLSGLAASLLIGATLVAASWRKPLTVLAGTCVPAIGVKATYLFLLPSYRYRHIPRPSASMAPVVDAISFAVAASVCVYLCRLLLSQHRTVALE